MTADDDLVLTVRTLRLIAEAPDLATAQALAQVTLMALEETEQSKTQSVDWDPLGEATRQRESITMTGAQLMDLVDERDVALSQLAEAQNRAAADRDVLRRMYEACPYCEPAGSGVVPCVLHGGGAGSNVVQDAEGHFKFVCPTCGEDYHATAAALSQLNTLRADTKSLCETCDADLFPADSPEPMDRWWQCGPCANEQVRQVNTLREALRVISNGSDKDSAFVADAALADSLPAPKDAQ